VIQAVTFSAFLLSLLMSGFIYPVANIPIGIGCQLSQPLLHLLLTPCPGCGLVYSLGSVLALG